MKPGACFINTSWAETVDHQALRKAVTEKGIRVGLDVVEGEGSGKEGTVETDLFDLTGVYGTHHIGASTAQATVLQVIKEKGINVDVMENTLFEGGEGACASIQIESALPDEGLNALREASGDIYAVTTHEIS